MLEDRYKKERSKTNLATHCFQSPMHIFICISNLVIIGFQTAPPKNQLSKHSVKYAETRHYIKQCIVRFRQSPLTMPLGYLDDQTPRPLCTPAGTAPSTCPGKTCKQTCLYRQSIMHLRRKKFKLTSKFKPYKLERCSRKRSLADYVECVQCKGTI